MASSITLTWFSLPEEGTHISFVDTLTGNPLYMVFENTRTSSGTTVIGNSISISVFRYGKYFGIDYNNTNLYSVSIDTSSQSVTITANNVNSQFISIENTADEAVSVSEQNEAPPVLFTLDSIAISEADINPCENVKLTITTNDVADKIEYPLEREVSVNPYIIDVPRKNHILVGMRLNESSKSRGISVPLLLASYFQINNISTPSDGIITVDRLPPLNSNHLLTFEYSLDNTDWQKSNYFNNLSEGDYTVYVRDNIGCSISIDFTIDEFAPNLVDYDGVFEISNINSIRFKEDVEWNEYILKTPTNTLSFEENVKLPNRSFTQLWTKNDIIPTQIKSNYSSITAKLIDTDNNEVDLVVSKKTNNMNVKDVRDGVVGLVNYNGSEYTSVKFSGGKTYDPLTLAELSDYNLGINLPSWMNSGDYINVQSVGWYKVLDTVWSEDAYVLVLNLLYQDFSMTPGTFKITSEYNLVDFESYEFLANFNLTDGYYKLEVNGQDDRFGTKKFTSEWQKVRDSYVNTFLIDAYNSENNEINYNTGIRHKLRIPFVEDLKWKSNTDQEIYVASTKTVPLKNKYRGFWSFSSIPLPTVMAEKLVLILLQDRLFIDTVSYVVEGDIETINIGSQIQIKANLVKSDYVFESVSHIDLNTIEGEYLIINNQGGFLRID